MGGASSPIVVQQKVPGLIVQLNALGGASRYASEARQLYKGIGGGAATFAVRCDDGQTEEYTVAYPLYLARGIPGTFAAVASRIGSGGHVSTAQYLEMQQNGQEVICHSNTHATVSSYSDSDFIGETATPARTMRALGLNVDGFGAPGTWTGSLMPTDPLYWDQTSQGQILREAFLWADTYSLDGTRSSGTPPTLWGGPRFFDATSETLANAIAWMDLIAENGQSGLYLVHPYLLGTSGCMSIADYAASLDHMCQLRDYAGAKILSESAQRFATPGHDGDNLCYDGAFERSGRLSSPLSVAAGSLYSRWVGTSGAPTVVSPGHKGLFCASVNSVNKFSHSFPAGNARRYLISGYARAAGSNTTGIVTVYDWASGSISKSIPVTSAWSPFSMVVGFKDGHSSLSAWRMELSAIGADNVRFTEFIITPV